MNLIKLSIRGISYSHSQKEAYALILEEEFGNRKLPIIVGNFEAQSIALALEKDIKPARPLTHDLFVTLGNRFKIKAKAVFIYKIEDGIFYSNILWVDKDGVEEEIDARTSDAIAIAVRFNANIYATEMVLELASIESKVIYNQVIVDNSDDEVNLLENDFSEKSSDELKILMKKAIDNEDYETAAKLRDELDSRN